MPATWFTLASSVASIVVSAIYLLVALSPIYYFHGLVQGFYSLLDYRLHYAVNQQPVSMPHTDYIRHVSLSFTASSLAVLLLSAASIIIFRWRLQLASGLVFGNASALILLHGLFNGYINRAVIMDLGRFSNILRDRVAVETSAGNITFIGTRIEPAGVILLATNTWLMLALIVAVAATSFASITLVSTKTVKPTLTNTPRLPGLRLELLYAMASIFMLSSFASVFVYYQSALTILPQPPPATLETPPYDYACTALARTSRGALTYTDFEAYPVPGWSNSGGIWTSVAGVAGSKGNVLQGADNNRGLGGESHYYYNTSASGNNWVAVKTRWVSGTGYYGISMMNTGRNRMYTVEIYRAEPTTGDLRIRSFNVIAPPPNRWTIHASVAIPGYSQESWYTIVVSYSASGTTITITAYLYDANGNYVTSASATITHRNVFTPAYLGVSVDDATAYFDEFILSSTDPRSISFTGFYTGMVVEVWDNLGSLVNSSTAPATSFTLSVTRDVVVGTGSDGRIIVTYPDAYLCGVLTVPVTDAVLGGDTYTLSTAPIVVGLGANKTSTSLTLYISGTSSFNTTARILRVNAFQLLYARLVLDTLSASSTLNLDVWIEGATNSTNISVRNGVPVATSTSIVQLNPGLGNTIHFSGYSASTSQSAVLNLKLELCTTATGAGACVCYPLNLTIHS